MKQKNILIGLFFLLISGLWVAQGFCVPSLINYQGRLTDTNGNPKSGTFVMKFRVYNDPTTIGDSFKWGEKQDTVRVNNGIFNVLLGDGTGIIEDGSVPDPPVDQAAHQAAFKNVFDGTDVWLEVQVDPDNPMQPRQQIVSVGYAMKAESAGSADNALTSESDPQVGSNSTNYVSKWNGSALVSGSIQDNGNVGIGKSPGSAKLDVNGNIAVNGTEVIDSNGKISASKIRTWSTTSAQMAILAGNGASCTGICSLAGFPSCYKAVKFDGGDISCGDGNGNRLCGCKNW